MKKINSKEISVVIQGAVIEKQTADCLNSVRKHLPDAQIIFSAWQGTDSSGLNNYDILVENIDPGAVIRNDVLKVANNLNRQIVSTKGGLEKADRKYVLKLRSDLVLKSDNFLNYFGKFPARNPEWSFLQERVLIVDIFTRNPNILRPYPFCPSDWVHFGLKEDVSTIWDLPLAEEPQYSRWFDNHRRPDPDYYPNDCCRYASEQYIWTGFLKKFTDINCEHQWDVSGKNRELTDLSFVNNCVILDLNKWKLFNFKYKNIRAVDWVSFYSHNQWKRLYKKYCAPDLFVLPDFGTFYKHYLLKTGKTKGVDAKTLQERKRINDLNWENKKKPTS